MSWDTVVIGSGPGGLTAAVALVRKGQRVLVLEQHYLPGGWCHSFSLGGHRFSPGVHYIGECAQGQGIRDLWEGLGLSRDLEMVEMNPEGFDHIMVGDERVDQPKGLARWKALLEKRFPHQHEGLQTYFDTLQHVTHDVQRVDELLDFPNVLSIPFKAPALLRWGFSTLAPLLDKCFQDPILKAILSATCGNHGLAPSRVSLPGHAVMCAHYFDGAYYPRGGAKSIPAACIKELRRHGGQIRTRARVSKILVEHNRAVGVELDTGERIEARDVVCNADPAVTYGKLLPAEMCPSEMKKARKMEYSVSFLSGFAVVDLPLRRMGYDSGNYWWYRNHDVGGLYERMEKELPGVQIDGIFLAISSLKDPHSHKDGMHTIEMFTFVPYEPFAKWRHSTQGIRDPEYQEMKRWLGAKMVYAADNVIPGFSRHLKLLEIGTPLTNDFYCETHRGAAYGTAKTPFQLGPFSFSQKSPVEHLTMCGASTFSHGVGGASLSGLTAAQHVLGLSSRDELLSKPDGSLRVYQAESPEAWVQHAA